MNTIERKKDNALPTLAAPLLPKKSMGFFRMERCFLVSLTKGRQNSKTADDCLPHGEWCYNSWK